MTIKERIEICKKCPILRTTEYGMVCDERKYISPDGKEASFFQRPGWKKGCGCIITIKARNDDNHCVVGKW